MKIRRVDFYPDDWIAGTRELADDERGVYVTICMLIYARGGPIGTELIKAWSSSHGNAFNRIIGRLEKLGKIIRNGPEISQKRCETELERARKRVGTAAEKAAKRWNNRHLQDAAASPADDAINHHTTTNIQHTSVQKPPQRRGARLPDDFQIPIEWRVEGTVLRTNAGLPTINLDIEADHFADYWHAKAGKDGCKLDWRATWRNWCRNAKATGANRPASNGRLDDAGMLDGPTGPPPTLEELRISMGRSH